MKLHPVVHRLTRGRQHSHHADRMVLVGRHAAWYDRVTARVLGRLYRAAANRVLESLPQDGHILDVGTGPGRLLVELAARRSDIRLAGVDPSADMVNHATRRLQNAALDDRADLRVASAEDLPFPNDTFNAVVSTLSSHHWADPHRAVAEQARVLRPGGALWIVDLRGVAPAAVTQALATDFPSASMTRVQLGKFMSIVITCQRAQKSSVTDGIAT